MHEARRRPADARRACLLEACRGRRAGAVRSHRARRRRPPGRSKRSQGRRLPATGMQALRPPEHAWNALPLLSHLLLLRSFHVPSSGSRFGVLLRAGPCWTGEAGRGGGGGCKRGRIDLRNRGGRSRGSCRNAAGQRAPQGCVRVLARQAGWVAGRPAGGYRCREAAGQAARILGRFSCKVARRRAAARALTPTPPASAATRRWVRLDAMVADQAQALREASSGRSRAAACRCPPGSGGASERQGCSKRPARGCRRRGAGAWRGRVAPDGAGCKAATQRCSGSVDRGCLATCRRQRGSSCHAQQYPSRVGGGAQRPPLLDRTICSSPWCCHDGPTTV